MPAPSSDQPSSPDQPEVIIASIQRPEGVTGLNTHIGQFRGFLEADGIAVTMLTPLYRLKALALAVFAARKLIDPLNGALGVWWFYRWRGFFLRLALSKALERGRSCVIYAQCLVSAQSALRARKHSGQKVVLAVHFNRSEAEEWHHAGKIQRDDWVYRGILALEAETLPKLDGLHFVSQFMHDHVHALYPAVGRCKSVVLFNFIADPGPPRAGERAADLICIGPLEPRKNQAYLIRVLHEAQKLGHRYSLALVGPGPDRQRLQQLARDLGVLDQVDFMGFQPDAKRLLPNHRAYVHSALIENFPFVLVEAAAYGLPVLAAPVGGVPEVFQDGEQGFYWPLEDPAEGARKLIAILEDEATYERLAKGARQRFVAYNAAETVAPKLKRFILSIAAEGTGERAEERSDTPVEAQA